MAGPRIAVVVGSKSDLPVMERTFKMLDRLGIAYTSHVMSAHRSPDKVREFARTATRRGLKVIIAAAGMAAHLPGVIAAQTPLPVIGVPLSASALEGVDALYSIVQMPSGVPVAAMAVGTAGAHNAAVFAAEILALADARLRKRVLAYKRSLAH